MKFFKFDLESYNFEVFDSYNRGEYDIKTITKTHYLNVDYIVDIVINSDNDDYFSLIIRGGNELKIKNEYLDSLLKLIDPDEKEAKK